MINVDYWENASNFEKWVEAKLGLGGTRWRLAAFDIKDRSLEHLGAAHGHFQDIRDACGDDSSRAVFFHKAGLNLANVLKDETSKADGGYVSNLDTGIKLMLAAAVVLDKVGFAREWGIIQHNLCISYEDRAATVASDMAKEDLALAIAHGEQSFEVRNPVDSLQYWIASCRSLASALISLGIAAPRDGRAHFDRARGILRDALS
jgi:hypothetical protein